ncbi:MAG: glycosyltransferase family 4 protein [candidate division Zixibacteria bacterium]|nr:glycosyltransferase family 4 protein [candidate division Zixibacteria bacterium]MDH3936861.1 glycosyltransferase family 4 protein [candidate division Zixibacteria bacterium]MDH4033706.1 glycosyltransferase family 4 protein [candidate division Zixibacteria bacterium]
MSKTIQLLVLTHNYPRHHGDHAGVFLGLLCRRLLDHSVQPIVLAPHDPGAPEYEENSGVRVHRFRYGTDQQENLAYHGNMQAIVTSSLRGMLRFRTFHKQFRRTAASMIETEKIDVIAGHWLVPAAMVMKSLAERYPLPMILSSHGTDIRLANKFGGLPYRYLRSTCRGLTRWTFVSSYLQDQILQLDPKLKDRLEVLPLPHDESVFYPDDSVEKRDGLTVAVTRFTQQKRVSYLIDAFAQVTHEVPEARLELYGGGPLQGEIERQIQSLDLTGKVIIHAPVSQAELRTIYNRASIVVLNSYREGFGMALSEAMLCGTAVVGVASGGITDIIAHEQRGLLAAPDSVGSLAAAITRLLQDSSLRGRLAAAGNEYAQATYASGPLAARYAQIVHDAASR